ncbi:hypothetical protein V8C34DRAFT_318581 [Trichoderma compactum]
MLCGEITTRNAQRQFAWNYVILQAGRLELIQPWSLPTESQEAKARKWTLLTLRWGTLDLSNADGPLRLWPRSASGFDRK